MLLRNILSSCNPYLCDILCPLIKKEVEAVVFFLDIDYNDAIR